MVPPLSGPTDKVFAPTPFIRRELQLTIDTELQSCDCVKRMREGIGMAEQELWYLLINGLKDFNEGVFGNFYAYGNHLGDALEKTITASSEKNQFSQHAVIEASCLDRFEANGKEFIKIAEDVYMFLPIPTYPLDASDKGFVPPTGIVKSAYDGEYDYDLIKENFAASAADEHGCFGFELVLDKKNLIDTFMITIGFLPAVDGFWIYIKNYWENELTELWVAKHFTDKRAVVDFLNRQKENTLENGYLDIVVHSTKGETNLILNDHKKIQLYSKDENVFRDFIGNIIDLGFEQTREFYSLESGYHHFHYRLANSLTRAKFKQMLIDNKFELMDKR